MKENRYGSHSVTRLTAHIVRVTKYRSPVLKGDVQKRCRELIIQTCDAEGVRILKGVVSKDHAHARIEYPTPRWVSDSVKRFKGRTSRLLQQGHPASQKQYWGGHSRAVGYGAWSAGNITGEVAQEYLEHHRHPSNEEADNFILEE